MPFLVKRKIRDSLSRPVGRRYRKSLRFSL